VPKLVCLCKCGKIFLEIVVVFFFVSLLEM
jgi:hypothetical protein